MEGGGFWKALKEYVFNYEVHYLSDLIYDEYYTTK